MTLPTPGPDARLLLAEDDAVFAATLTRALCKRGFEVTTADNAAAALKVVVETRPRFAVVDLKLGADNGLTLIPALREAAPEIRILLLTGYSSIATAVEAIKRGAHDYLAKPVDADAVVHALLHGGEGVEATAAQVPRTPLALRRVEWEHLQRTLQICDGNVSETARRLGMHRRTLQRKLAKHPVHERREF